MKIEILETCISMCGRLLTAGLLCAACWVFGCARGGTSDPADASLAADRVVYQNSNGPCSQGICSVQPWCLLTDQGTARSR
jgi:hypothetical protein